MEDQTPQKAEQDRITVCRLQVYGVGEGNARTLVANGQQTLIRVDRTAE